LGCFARGEFPSRAFAAHRPDCFVVTANVLGDRAVALETPTRVLHRRSNGTALILLSAPKSVAAVCSPRKPQSISEGPVNDFDGDLFSPK
jgi:hypothetical protein